MKNINQDKLVSIIMPCFNSEATLSESIESVLKQTYKDFELIIIDDSSTDNSINIQKKYSKIDDRIHIFSNSKHKKGVSHARNIGIEKSRGRYICFLDSDDLMTEKSVEIRVNLLIRSQCSVVFGSYARIRNGIIIDNFLSLKDVCFHDMLRSNKIGNLTGMYDTKYTGKIFQKNINHEDYLMWCELLKGGNIAKTTGSEILGYYRVSNKSLSGNKIKASFWHWLVLRNGLNISFLKSIWFQINYIFFSIIKRIKIHKSFKL